MPKKTFMKPCLKNGECDSELQHKVKQSVDADKKVKAKDVFEGYVPRTSSGKKIRKLKS